jgi:aquacobalamin reductase/NAD(P)H-flavin reductase
MTEFTCQVLGVSALTSSIMKIELSLPDNMLFKAGQYIQVVMGEKDKRPFSIASGPAQNTVIELHIGADPANTYAYEVIQQAKNTGVLTLDGPHGDAYLRDDKDIDKSLIIAGGTGYSYARSLLEQWLISQPTKELILYWGTQSVTDMYEMKRLEKLAQEQALFTFIPVVETTPDNWTGKTGWVHKAVLADYPDLAKSRVYVAGRFEMAKVIKQEFTTTGLQPENLIGDAFAFI